MNWDAIGAIGEVVSGVAVIATLIYLALQLRQYSDGLNSATIQQNMLAFNEINMMLAADVALAEIIERGNEAPETLSIDELRMYSWTMRSYINLYENLHEQFKKGTCPPDFWKKNALELKSIAGSAGVRLFREQNTFHEELFQYIDRLEDDPGQVITFSIRHDSNDA